MKAHSSSSWGMEGLNLGFGLAACILVGAGLGWFLDRYLSMETPWFTIGLTLVGLAAGMREVFALSERLRRRADRERDDGGRSATGRTQ